MHLAKDVFPRICKFYTSTTKANNQMKNGQKTRLGAVQKKITQTVNKHEKLVFHYPPRKCKSKPT
jgi:hypothetical protein